MAAIDLRGTPGDRGVGGDRGQAGRPAGSPAGRPWPGADELLPVLPEVDDTRASPPVGPEALLLAVLGAVPSCLSVTLTAEHGGVPHTLMAVVPGSGSTLARTSIAVRLPRQPGREGIAAVLVLRAHQTGAFDDVATSVPQLLGLGQGAMVLDQHLAAADAGAVDEALAASLADGSVVERALGVLLDRGLVRDDAMRGLQRLADAADATLLVAAAAIVASTAVAGTDGG